MNTLDTSRLDDLKFRVKDKLENTELFKFKGSVSKLLGLTVEVKLPGLKVGDLNKRRTQKACGSSGIQR